MITTLRSDVSAIIPEVLAEEFSKGIAGMEVFNGSGVFTVNPGLQAGVDQVGSDVKVPYFENIGKAQQVAAGAALTPKKLTVSSETGTVIHIGDAVSISGWAARAKQNGRSLYDVAREQLLMGFRGKVEDLMVDELVTRAVAASMVYDGSAGNFDVPAIVGVQKKFGDELASRGGLRMWAMQSKPYWDAAVLADSTGRTLLTPVAGEELMRLGGKPVMMSDRATLLVGTTPAQYYTVAAKAGAGAIWYNANVEIETDRDSLADDDLLIYHVYLVVHAYSVMAGGTKAGVAAAKTL
jgi:hypothetical protein